MENMKNTIILILSILVIGLGGYVIFDKVVEKKNGNGINSPVAEENFDLNSARVLINRYTKKNSGDFLFWQSLFDAGQMSDSQKVYIAFDNTKVTWMTYNCETAFPQGNYVSESQYSVMENSNGICYDGDKLQTYTDLSETYKELFGQDAVLPKTEVSVGFSRSKYSEKYDSYIGLSCECGGVSWQESYFDVVDAKLKGDNLEIFVKYAKFESDSDAMYLTTDKTLKIIGNHHDVTEEQLKDIYDKGIDTLPTYKFEFKKSDLGYYFNSMELVS